MHIEACCTIIVRRVTSAHIIDDVVAQMVNDVALSKPGGTRFDKAVQIIEIVFAEFRFVVENIELDAADVGVVENTKFKREHILFGNFFKPEAVHVAVAENLPRIAPSDGIVLKRDKIDGGILYMRQFGERIVFAVVGGECVVGFIVAVGVDEDHVSVFGHKCKSIRVAAIDDAVFVRFLQQLSGFSVREFLF